MSSQYDNGFCPQCGALLRDGVCPCCQHSAQQDSDYNPYANQYQDQYNNNESYSNVQKKAKSSTGLALIIGGILLFILIVSTVVVTYAGYKYGKNHPVYDDKWEYDWDDDAKDNDAKDDDYEYDWDDYDGDSYDYDASEGMTDFVNEIDWNDKSWKNEPENYAVNELGDKYYDDIRNCINSDVPYKMNYETYEKLEKDNNVCIRVGYYQLDGDIPNLDDINATLKNEVMYAADIYDLAPNAFADEFEKYGAGYVVDTKSYITFNDRDSMSVVVYEKSRSALSHSLALYSINIDLITGTVIENTSILDVSDDLIKELIKICKDQNGEETIANFTNDEIKDYLKNDDNLIVFYTPKGMEIGFNYETTTNYGWITTTIKDYEKFVKSY